MALVIAQAWTPRTPRTAVARSPRKRPRSDVEVMDLCFPAPRADSRAVSCKSSMVLDSPLPTFSGRFRAVFAGFPSPLALGLQRTAA